MRNRGARHGEGARAIEHGRSRDRQTALDWRRLWAQAETGLGWRPKHRRLALLRIGIQRIRRACIADDGSRVWHGVFVPRALVFYHLHAKQILWRGTE